jgi:DNA-binding response OmpR family regulator
MTNVLIVDDDPVMLRGLKDNFVRRGYRVSTATDGIEALDAALENRPDLLILDLMLPHMNGYEICRNLRAESVETPTIMLTAKSEENDMLLGFGVGADDYVTKPFSIGELLARSEALLRRSGKMAAGGAIARFGQWELDRGARQLRRCGEADEVSLSPKEYALLEYLVEHPGRALSREQIMNSVWGYGCIVTHRSIDRFVTGLRKKIEAVPERPQHILTVREFGYRFVA